MVDFATMTGLFIFLGITVGILILIKWVFEFKAAIATTEINDKLNDILDAIDRMKNNNRY